MNFTTEFLGSLVVRRPLHRFSSELFEEQYFEDFVRRLEFDEEMVLASPNIADKLRRKGQNDFDVQPSDDLMTSVFKYFIRCHTRATPFGLFAETGVIKWGQRNLLQSTPTRRLEVRLDQKLSRAFLSQMNARYAVRRSSVFYPNSSMLTYDNYMTYLRVTVSDFGKKHELYKVQGQPVLNNIVELTRKGATLSELFEEVVKMGIDRRSALGFIHQIIDSQIIISSIQLPVTGKHTFLSLVEQIEGDELRFKGLKNRYTISVLANLQAILSRETSLRNKDEEIKFLLRKIDIRIENPVTIQANVSFASDMTLSSSYQTSLQRTLEALYSLRSTRPEIQSKFDSFKKRFKDRYGDRRIKLLTVFDEKSGLNYLDKSTSSTESLILKDVITSPENPSINISIFDDERYLLKELKKSKLEGLSEIRLKSAEIVKLQKGELKVSDTMNVMFKILDNDSVEEKIFFKGAYGPSATNMLARFSTGNDEIDELCKEIACFEQRQKGNQIVAEILHLPDDRLGNILSRTSFRDWEIPVYLNAEVSHQKVLKLSELSLSIVENEFVLWSEEYDKVVYPVHSNAYSYENSQIAVFVFLCDLQSQNLANNLQFSWGKLEMFYNTFPRVLIDDVIVSPTKWIFGPSSFPKDFDDRSNDFAIEKIMEWCTQHNLPKVFYIVKQDNMLLVDTGNRRSILTMISEMKRLKSLVIEETLESEISSIGFTEFLAPVVFKNQTPKALSSLDGFELDYDYQIGSRWLYAKLYIPSAFENIILKEVIQPLIESLERLGMLKSWFFIRYSDPNEHLRIRFEFFDESMFERAETIVRKSMNEVSKFVANHKFVYEPYQREIERYGHSSMHLAEEIFHSDSNRVIHMLNSEPLETNREILSFVLIDKYLSAFNLSLSTKLEFTSLMASLYDKEFNGGNNREARLQLNKKYLELRKTIDLTLNNRSGRDVFFRQLSSTAEKVIAIINGGKTTKTVFDLLSSYIHMAVNRHFDSEQRLREYLIYEMMKRHYTAKIHKGNNQSTQQHN